MSHRIAAIQMTSGMDLDANLSMAQALLTHAAEQGAALAVLPEMFPLLGKGDVYKQAKRAIQEDVGAGKIQDFLSEQAHRLKMWVVGGTIPLDSPDPDKSYAACLVLNAQGEAVGQYNKIHLFDAKLNETEFYRESDTTYPGAHTMVLDTPVGRLGLSVCYDIRFPALYHAMFKQDVEVFAIPSAFTVPTGKAHWDILLRARAIENFAYVVAADQWGLHGQGRRTFGNSMIVDPTGRVIERLESGIGIVMAEIDLDFLKAERKKIPVAEHQRHFK